MISNKFLPLKAAASRPGFGFSPSQAGPKPSRSRHFGPAWLGLFGPGLARLTASGRAMHIPSSVFNIVFNCSLPNDENEVCTTSLTSF